MDNRVIYDSQALIQNVETVLERFSRFRYDSKYRQLLGDAFVEKLIYWEQQIRHRKEDPFTIVVCGDFKRGKSSVINALLGEDVVPVNVTTETVTLNRISYGPHSNEAVLSGGRRLVLTDEELERVNLEKAVADCGENVQRLNIKRPLEFLKDVTIIDTPGLGDAFRDFNSLVGEALMQADAVIYVFSASYPLSRNEQMFLRTSVLPQKYTELFVVANFADTMSSITDYERMGDLIQKRIENMLSRKVPYLVSALDERCLQLGENRPNPMLQEVLENSFQRFRQDIGKLIEDKKTYVLPDRMERLLGMMREELTENLALLERGIDMSEQQLKEATDRLVEQKAARADEQEEKLKEIGGTIQDMKGEAEIWIEELLCRMEAEVDGLEKMDSATITKYYSFYCMDLLQNALEKCVEFHQELLFGILENISEGLAKGMENTNLDKSYQFRFALDNRTWTKGDNVGVVVNWLLGNSLLSVAVDGIAGSMREKELAKKTPALLQTIHTQYGSLNFSVKQAVDKLYESMEQNIRREFVQYSMEKMSELENEIAQSAHVAQQNEAQKAEIRVAVQEIGDILKTGIVLEEMSGT